MIKIEQYRDIWISEKKKNYLLEKEIKKESLIT